MHEWGEFVPRLVGVQVSRCGDTEVSSKSLVRAIEALQRPSSSRVVPPKRSGPARRAQHVRSHPYGLERPAEVSVTSAIVLLASGRPNIPTP